MECETLGYWILLEAEQRLSSISLSDAVLDNMDQNLFSFINDSDIKREQNVTQFEIPKWIQTLQLVFVIILCIVGLLGNGLIVIIQTRIKDKTSTDYLVLTMALLDLFCSTCVTPFYMAQNIPSVWDVVFSSIFCKLKYFIIYGTNISSTMLFSALAFDRYMRTCNPFSSLYTCSKSKALCVIIISFGFSMAMTSFVVYDQNEVRKDCIKVEGTRVMETVMNSCLTGTFILLFGMVVFCYTKVTLKIRERTKVRTRRKAALLRKGISSSHAVRLLKSQKIKPLPFPDDTQSSRETNVFESRITNIKNPPPGSSGSCSVDPGDGAQKTGNDALAFVTGMDSQVKHSSSGLTLTTAALRDIRPRQSNIYSAVKKSYIRTKEQNILFSQYKFENNHTRILPSWSRQQTCDFSHKHLKRNLGSEQQSHSHLKEQTQQQTHQQTQQSEENTVISEREKKELRKVNYVTFMMFLITATYVITWVSAWVLYAIFNHTTFAGRVVLYNARISFVVNYIANPIFFIFMSAKFRERVKNLICCKK